MRIFIDTNVLFSGAYERLGGHARLLDAAAAGRYSPVISRVVIDEVVRNLRRKAPQALGSLERIFREVSFDVAQDPSAGEIARLTDLGFGTDAPVVAAAVAAQVDYFCTGDKRLRARSEEIVGLKLVSPAELLELLADGDPQ